MTWMNLLIKISLFFTYQIYFKMLKYLEQGHSFYMVYFLCNYFLQGFFIYFV